ncbi:WD40 repeat domain-containing protein [Candidatus Solirubrobacter pratensis]|uniref:WD40 repeat domain-containing protein n=1 Tax=Candidatus Solirubrobacter pratensis TaxID=1298857 RepID=UPI00041026B8|nr:WD40 repeat domain-containing protein [Candidatus Solirubrobacter pratensis]
MTAVGLELAREWHDAIGQRVAYAPDGSAWACSSRQELRLFEDDALVAAEGVAGEILGELTFSSDGARVLVAPLAYDRGARAWAPRPPVAETLATGLPSEAAEGFMASAGAWAPDGSALALYGEYRPPRGTSAGAGWSGPPARLVLLDGDAPLVIWEGTRSEPRTAIVVGDALVASGGRAIDVRDRASGRPLAVLAAFATVARTLRLDGAHLAAGSADGTVAVWDSGTWEEVARWLAHEGEAAGLAWHPGGEALATGGEDGLVRLWSLAGDLLGQLDAGAPVTGLAFHPSGKRLLAARAGPAGGVAALELVA